ncbi:MAG: sugar nucleotide-binding protein [Candidatus Peribacteraceae bacterium]|nr:sugar nucleotide-binding protein [Candidatus Peribacteraceae bacterium]
MNVLIFGSRGYIGSQFLQLYPGAAAPSVDIADAAAVAAILDTEKPDVVINAAGKTGRPNVDWCEDHRMETLRSNVTGPLTLLEECGKRGIYWVHLGSGCIYAGDNGGRGFTEEDPPNFEGSFYSFTKNVSDRVLQRFTSPAGGTGGVLNLRLRMPFDGTTSPRNLLTKLKGYAKVLDVPNSMTFIPEFLSAAAALIGRRSTGTFNMVNEGAISPYEIMTMYRDIVDPSHTFERLTLQELPGIVKAVRSNCVLSCAKLREAGIVLSPVRSVVGDALRTLRKAG